MSNKLGLIGGKTVTRERDDKGKFVYGNIGGPGRPPRQIEAEYLKATMRGCSLEDWTAIVKRAVADAKGGNAKAREWLGRHLLGNPETKAPSLFQVAVEEEAGMDRVKDEATRQKVFRFGASPLRAALRKA